ncbi:hypothetical protein [Salinarimonas soli]|uniref:Uncharacterized protein n=1 Tax=Salinarimonas soli TaxID=1638099 RepID=A0A5B2VDI3_9HYPH|nr:hypothetical protein [Salinarimonas soli]KAA2237573.1 hypothetical protein F0L46_11365 [Salinarimonas soli]
MADHIANPTGDRARLQACLLLAEARLARTERPPAASPPETARAPATGAPPGAEFMLWRPLLLAMGSIALLVHALDRMK